MSAAGPKGPFKGKGGKLVQWRTCLRMDPDAVAWQIERRKVRRDEVSRALRQLAARVKETWSRPPLRLVYVSGQGYVWRQRAARPSDETIVASLSVPGGRRLMDTLDASTCRVYLGIEVQRLDLNTEWLLLSYEIRMMEKWMERKKFVCDHLAAVE